MTRAELDTYISVRTDRYHITNVRTATGISWFDWTKGYCAGDVRLYAGSDSDSRIVYFENEVDAIMFKLKWT